MDSNVLIRVFDTELNYLGQVDDYESLIFRRKWSGYGEFEITLGYCSPILQARRFILLDEDPKRSGCIEYVQYDEAKGTYTVKGFSLLKLLETRITVPPKGKANQSYQGTPAEILQQLVTANAIAPEDSQRVIPHLVLGDRPSSGGSITYETCYNILAEDIRSIANACSLGAEIELNWREQRLEFVVRQGVDHTAAQSLQPRVIFSDAYDNISEQVYTLDVSSERNIGYVAGREEGEDRKVVTVDLAGASGFERKEVFIDAHDVEEGANENALLRERGIAGLSAMRAADSYDFTVVSGTAMQYLQDWDLGDLVTVISDPLNTVVDERILEVEEVYDASGAQITPTVGEPEKTLQEKISGGSNGGGSYYDKANHSHPYLATSLNGAKNGVASLDENGLVPASQLPSYVDDVLEYDKLASFPAAGEAGKIYVAHNTNKTYRWSGTAYVEISASLALGETSSTAYRGDRGKIAYDHSQKAHVTGVKGNSETAYRTGQVNITKANVGLGNVPNVATNNQTPTYTAASANENLVSGEKLSVAMGKISRAITSLISHLADGTRHITAAERTAWNSKARVFSTQKPAFPDNGDMIEWATVTHNLNTENVMVSVWEVNSKSLLATDVEVVDANSVQLWLPKGDPGTYNIVIVG